MTDLTKTAIFGIIDRSGSMHPIAADTEGGWATFLAEQAKLPGACRVSLAQFDHEYELVYVDVPIADVDEYKLHARGRTALLDAIGLSIQSLGNRLGHLPEDERPGSVIVVILTDGFENASEEYTAETIKSMIELQREKYGWQFMFFGADENAIATAQSYGMSANTAASYSRDKTAETFSVASHSTTVYRSARAGGQSVNSAAEASGITVEQREALKGSE